MTAAVRRCRTAGDRDAWLSCYADDAVPYDPVGGSPLDAQGTGIRGLAGHDGFWRQAIAPNQVRFDVTAVQVVSLRGYWDVQRVLSALSA